MVSIFDFDWTITILHTYKSTAVESGELTGFLEAEYEYGHFDAMTNTRSGLQDYLRHDDEENTSAIATFHNNHSMIAGYIASFSGRRATFNSTRVSEDGLCAVSFYALEGINKPFLISWIPASGSVFKETLTKLGDNKNYQLEFLRKVMQESGLIEADERIHFYDDTPRNCEFARALPNIEVNQVQRSGSAFKIVNTGASSSVPVDFLVYTKACVFEDSHAEAEACWRTGRVSVHYVAACYAEAGNHAMAERYVADFGARFELVVQGYAMAGNDEKLHELYKMKRASAELISSCYSRTPHADKACEWRARMEPKAHTSDLHCHLHGCVSRSFLEETAIKNGRLEAYHALMATHEAYAIATHQQPETGFSEEITAKSAQQLEYIHSILCTLEDIQRATEDVVQNARAKYLEIRTTPAAVNGASCEQYIQAFEEGLLNATHLYPQKKAFGLLSIDRSLHTPEHAEAFIAYIKTRSRGHLLGLDIGGNPEAPRTLTSAGLHAVISKTLNAGLALTIHMGEIESIEEREDIDTILDALEAWSAAQPQSAENPTNPLHGRVRLSHCIYLTDTQRERIRALNAPIEVCPTAHRMQNWHLETAPHPVTRIYPDIHCPVIVGTDSETVFGESAKSELSTMIGFFGNRDGLSRREIKAHQETFAFSPFAP